MSQTAVFKKGSHLGIAPLPFSSFLKGEEHSKLQPLRDSPSKAKDKRQIHGLKVSDRPKP